MLLALAALSALALLAATALLRRPPPGVPLSPVAAGLWVGPDFWAREGLELAGGPAPGGLVDAVADLAWEDLPAEAVPGPVRDFLERTGRFELLALPRWRLGFRTGGWLALRLSRLVGQFDIPFGPSTVLTRLVPLRAGADLREGVRGVVRTYAHDGRTMQVASYATHAFGVARYLNCAFPLPGGNLAGLLRLDPVRDPAGQTIGAELTTRPLGRGPEGAGIWYVWRGPALRLPLDETLSFWPAPAAVPELPGATLEGLHRMRLFGLEFLRTRYLLRPLSEPQ
jgi:hypothetical protein